MGSKGGGSVVARGGEHLMIILTMLLLGALTCLLIGHPIVAGPLTASATYWTLLFSVILGFLAILFYSLAVMNASTGLVVFSGVTQFFALLAQIACVGFFISAWVNCKGGNVLCSSDLNCAGATVGAYVGPRGTFVALFVVLGCLATMNGVGLVLSFFMLPLLRSIAASGAKSELEGRRSVAEAYPTAEPWIGASLLRRQGQ